MEQLRYRDILDKKYKNYRGELRVFESYSVLNNEVTIRFSQKTLVVEYLNDYIVKVFLGENNEREILTNAVILNGKNNKIISVEDTIDKIIINGEKIITEINKLSTEITFLDVDKNIICEDFQPSFKDEEENIYISKVNDCIAYYGLGEKGGNLNKKGTYTENYNTDDPETTDDSIMYYKTIPFYIGVKKDSCHGIYFDNSFRSYYDMGKEHDDRIFFGAVGGQIRYYFILGNDVKDVVKEYTNLTGRMDMPPLWSLGYQQNRFSYFSQEEVYDVVRKFKENDIPLDVIYLDIDYMDGFRVMTFKSPNFKNAKKLIKDLKDMGIKTVTILDPGVKVDENYDIYKSGKELNIFSKKLDGEVFVGAVWPGDSAFPDFSNQKCRTWWKDNLKKFIGENNIDGIWNDMNEPCVFNNDYKTMLESCIHESDFGVIEHKEFHNRYGFEMSRCSNEAQKELNSNKREFSMTRATFAGGQRYSSVWTGDNMSLWSQMKMSIVMNSNLGLSGFSFVGNDVGGFGLDCEEELFIRWMELGAFLPIFRNHSNMYTRRQEPWAFGQQTLEISKKFINLRYELIPYIYNSFFQSYKEGIPVFRPLVMDYKNDINVYNLKEEFMFGDNILVAPVLAKNERSKIVYLPEGNWYNYFTNEKFEGNKRYKLRCELDEILVFVKEGSIIPVFLDRYMNMDNRPNKVTFKVYGENAEGYYYFDDGYTMGYKNGEYNLSKICYKENNIDIKFLNKGIDELEKEFIFIL